MLMPFGLAMLTVVTTGDERPRYLALLLSSEALSNTFGPLFGAVFAEQLSFRYAFLVNVPLVIIFGASTYLSFNYQPLRRRSYTPWRSVIKDLDLPGSA